MRFNSIPSAEQAGAGTMATLALASGVGAALAATTTLPDLIAMLRQQLKWLIPAAHISLCLLDEGGDTYRTLTPTAESVYPITEGLAGWVLSHRVALDIPDLLDETRLPPGVGGVALHQGNGALLVLPLEAEGAILGVLCLGSPHVAAYAQVDRGLVSLITLQVAAALRTVLLIAELDSAEAIVASMARAVDAKDPYTRGHSDRVTAYALALAAAAALPPYLREIIGRAGPLHDVGKIGVPDHVLAKPGRLDDDEFALIKQHPVIGDEICRPLRALRRLRPAVRHHHERYDGGGYPDGLVGEEIPLEARVLAIADTYDAMTSDRPYRSGMPPAQALAILSQNAGPQWDPHLTRIFCALHGA